MDRCGYCDARVFSGFHSCFSTWLDAAVSSEERKKWLAAQALFADMQDRERKLAQGRMEKFVDRILDSLARKRGRDE